MTETPIQSENNSASRLNLFKAFFLLMLLVTMISLGLCERAISTGITHGTLSARFLIFMPWLLTALTGALIWKFEQTKQISTSAAGILLLEVGLLVMFSYQALEKFVVGH